MSDKKLNPRALNIAAIEIANAEGLLSFEVKRVLENVSEFGSDMEKASAEKLKSIFYDYCWDELHCESEDLGHISYVSYGSIPLDEAIDALTEKYLSELNVNKPHAISMLLETELLNLGIDKSEVSFSRACQIWFDKCEATFINMYSPHPPSSPARALAA